MAIQSQPSRIPEPFAGSGTKNTIPATNATPSASQAASWASGFPPECSQPISAGGCPVPRDDVNGALNQLSQDFAFRQDGGVWEWSALADYDTQRMVRGSNGDLYWSVAQSGPGVASGAVDPTADDGTYWQAPHAKTMPALENSGAIATTKWVRDAIASAPIYVDSANGDDSNDGLSQVNAVKTIGQALTLGNRRTGVPVNIFLAAGTYNENISLSLSSVYITLQGNATLNGYIHLNASNLFVESDSYSLTVSTSYNYAINAETGSRIAFLCQLNVVASGSGTDVLIANYSSSFVSTKTININTTDANVIFTAHNCSCFVLYASIVIAGSNARSFVDLQTSSSFYSEGGISSSVTFAVSGIYVQNSSSVRLTGTISITATVPVTISSGSSFVFSGSGDLTLTATGNNAYCFSAIVGSVAMFDSTGVVSFIGTGLRGFVRSVDGSNIILNGSSIVFSGSTNLATVVVNYGGYAGFANVVSGSVTGKRYYVSYAGNLIVNGAGENLIPGTTAGSVDTAKNAYYG